MNNPKKRHLSVEAAVEAHKNKILNSSLFKLDENSSPIAIYGLTPGKKTISKKHTIDGIPEFNIKILSRKLSEITGHYAAGIPYPLFDRSEYQHDRASEAEAFVANFIEFIEPYFMDKDKLEPQLCNFLKKAKKRINKEFSVLWGSQKPPNNKRTFYHHLIFPLNVTLQKYLTDQKSQNPYATEMDIFYYIAHLLLICGFDSSDHNSVYEKIRRYIYHYRDRVSGH